MKAADDRVRVAWHQTTIGDGVWMVLVDGRVASWHDYWLGAWWAARRLRGRSETPVADEEKA